MANVLIRVALFVSSYFPLLVIVCIEQAADRPAIGWGALGVGCAGLLGLGVYLATLRRIAPVTVKVESVRRRDAEVMSYIMTYVIKFLAIPWDKPRQATSLLIFFVVLGVLYVSNNFIHVNPTLNALGFRLAEVTDEHGDTYSVLARRRIVRGGSLRVVRGGDDILLEVD